MGRAYSQQTGQLYTRPHPHVDTADPRTSYQTWKLPEPDLTATNEVQDECLEHPVPVP